jgi:Arc/MetJ-type ribon-helix-helix transcriptional regulator
MSHKKAGRAPSTRFTVSLPDPLMRVLDRLRTDRRYGNRSEFVRDLLRAELVKEEWADQEGDGRGAGARLRSRHARAGRQAQRHPARVRAWPTGSCPFNGVRYGQLVPAAGKRLM